MNSIIRVMAAVGRVFPGNPELCEKSVEELLASLESSPADIVILPKLALSSPSCGNLFSSVALLDACQVALDRLKIASCSFGGYLIVGLPLYDSGTAVSAIAVLHGGELLGLMPTLDNPGPLEGVPYSDRFLPVGAVFTCGDLRFSILSCDPALLPARLPEVLGTGADLLVAPSYQPVTAGYPGRALEAARVVSQSLGCAVAVVNGGVGDTSSPFAYEGFAAVYECGETLCEERGAHEAFRIVCDLDTDIIHAEKKLNRFTPPCFSVSEASFKRGLLRPLPTNPYLPAGDGERNDYLDELYRLQVSSLCARLQNTGIKKMVIGVSGGLDSTLALLVAAGAADRLGLPRQNIVGITMPGFGTSDRTYFNALGLMEVLETETRDIPIRASISQHFEDISHNPSVRDVTYENAQARERSQILFDVANSIGALVVGTGDLSEEALGWSTFGGDHLAGYNVNSCITKTTIRLLVARIAERDPLGNTAEYLRDVLATPVSPELLPAEESGEIAQKTEDILGPYELHDFFLYYFVRYGFRPSKLYYYACIAFSKDYEPKYIREKLLLFLRRFASGQFKRSCAPDGAAITDVNLSNARFYIPSDLNPALLLRDVEEIDF